MFNNHIAGHDFKEDEVTENIPECIYLGHIL